MSARRPSIPPSYWSSPSSIRIMLSALRAMWVSTCPTVQSGSSDGCRGSKSAACVEACQQTLVGAGGTGDVPDRARRVVHRAATVTGDVATWRNAARDDRPRTDGRQHGPAADGRRARVRRPRRERGGDRRPRTRGCPRCANARGVRRRPHRAASRLDHGAGRVRRGDRRSAGAAARRPATRSSTAATAGTATTSTAAVHCFAITASTTSTSARAAGSTASNAATA